MSAPCRVAVVGLGGMGHHHAAAVVAEQGCELAGGAEIDAIRARQWQSAFAAPVYDDFESLFDHESPQVAIISTQAPAHHDPTLAAARRGIHVFCEKPIALDLVQADEMVAVCSKREVRFAINHLKRASPYNRHVLDRIAAGDIGQVLSLRATNKGGRRAGNELMEMGTHLYDWMRLLAGDVEWIHGHLLQLDGRPSIVADIRYTQEVNPKDRDAGLVLGERAYVSARFHSGVHGEIQFAAEETTDDSCYGIDIIGSEGRIALRRSVGTEMFLHNGGHMSPTDSWQRISLEEEDVDERGQRRDAASVRLLLQRFMLRDLVARIDDGGMPLSCGEDGQRCLEMIHATYESHRREQRVYMPLTPREHPLTRWRAGT
ncbi:MAG: Gfo/Idh/MocA family oxidoreductase [Candidatus Latescibacterota bacterium]|nr:Gfo/Idh/MocA family oxidoreductase [Candidatus Latescibacterota bacterium]